MNSDTRITTLQDRLDDMTEAERGALQALHILIAEVKANPRSMKYDPVEFIEDIEFTMQGIWGFSRDSSYHTHWMDIEDCTCPKLDNLEGIPFRRITSKTCPWHGVKVGR